MPYHPRSDIPPERQTFSHWRGGVGCLLLHGFMGSPNSWRPLADHLAAHDITCHVPLLPGHGHLPDKIHKIPHTHWLSAASAALGVMRQHCHTVFVMGHSMGAVLAAHLATHHTADVRGLVLIAPLYEVPDKRIRLTRWARYLLPYAYPLRLPNFPRDLALARVTSFDPTIDLDDPEVQEWLGQGTRISNWGVAEMCRMADVGRTLWPQVQTPTLVVQGGRDRALHSPHARTLLAELPTAAKELFWLDQADHDIIHPESADHALVWEKIRAFVNE